MQWIIPGTVLPAKKEDMEHIEDMFRSMFLGGDMVLSQVAAISGLEPYTIQNWVKRGFLSPPQRKRYNMNQLCRILNINMLKSALPMEKICGMLSYINGHLDDVTDDIIRDTDLFFIFVQVAAQSTRATSPEESNRVIEEFLKSYEEPVPGAKERVAKVLSIMLTAWASAQLQRSAEQMLAQL